MSSTPSAAEQERGALALVTNGFRVFPITAGRKSPPLVKYTEKATDDPNTAADMWREHPGANIGVATGRGLMVLDPDSPAAARFVRDLELPKTTTAKTPRGAEHIFLQGTARTGTDVHVPGLDIRGEGGYAVGVGSVVRNRRYEWVIPPWEIPPQPAPKAVLELATERAKFQVMDERPIFQGQRNSSLTRSAGWFVAQGIRGEPLRGALHAINRGRCRPALPEKEVERILKSAHSWAEPPLWLIDPVRYAEDSRLSGPARHVLTALAARAHHDGRVRGGDWVSQVIGWESKTVYRAIAELERHRRLTVHRYRKIGKANDYKLLDPPTSNSGMGVPLRDTGSV